MILNSYIFVWFFFFKQKTAYEMLISDWSSDVCSSDLVGKNLMVQSNQAVFGTADEEVRWYKAPPSLSISEHWNYEDQGKDYFGGWCFMSQGPLPAAWARILSTGRGLWGERLVEEMQNYNHHVGLKIVGEVLPREENCVTLTDERDGYGLPEIGRAHV